MKKLLLSFMTFITIGAIASPIVINIGGQRISISPPSDYPILYNIPTNAIIVVTIPGVTNYQVSYWYLYTNLLNSVESNSTSVLVPATNIYSGGTLPTGVLTAGGTNLVGHLLAVANGVRYNTDNGGNLTNVPVANLAGVGINTPAFVATNHVASYGAYPNGYIYDSVSCTNGSLIVTATPSPGAPSFSSSMIGDLIAINYAGANSHQYVGIVSNIINATTLGVYTAPVRGMTNGSYLGLCTTNSSSTNYYAIRQWANSVTNGYINGQDTKLILDPPIYYTSVLGSNSVGQCYMVLTNFQNVTQNNAMWIIPPVNGGNVYGNKVTVEIDGSYPYVPWEGGANVVFNPNESVIFIVGTGNNANVQFWHGSSVFDFRNFANPSTSSESPAGSTAIPGNQVSALIQNITLIGGYDNNMYWWNCEGCQEGTTWNNDVVMGGDVGSPPTAGLSFPWARGDYASGTNGCAFVPPASFFGTQAYINNCYAYGCYAAIAEGILSGGYVNVNNCSNAIEFGNSGGPVMNLQGLACGGVFNVIHNRIGLQETCATFNLNCISINTQVLPSGYNVNLISDDYWNSDSVHDMFYKCNGLISYSTNQNHATGLVNTTSWNYNGNAVTGNGDNGMGILLWGANGPVYQNGNQGFQSVSVLGSDTPIELPNTYATIGYGPGNIYQAGYYFGILSLGLTAGSWFVRDGNANFSLAVQPDQTLVLYSNVTDFYGKYIGNGGAGTGITNLTTSYYTNAPILGGLYTNTTTETMVMSIPVIATQPLNTIGSAEIDAQTHAPGLAFATIQDCSVGGGVTGALETNKETLFFPVPPGWAYCITNNVSGTGYMAGIDNSSGKTNTVTFHP